MRRVVLVAVAFAAVLALGTVPATADGPAEVIHGSWPCFVGWSVDNFDLEGECDVQNVRTAAGDYHLILHGQIPEEAMEDFLADGTPKRFFDPFCLVNWRFFVESGMTDPWLFTESVRKFTPNGQMTQVCHPPVWLTVP